MFVCLRPPPILDFLSCGGQAILHIHLIHLKVVGNEKGGGVGRLATVQRCFRTVAIDVCLLFNIAVVFS